MAKGAIPDVAFKVTRTHGSFSVWFHEPMLGFDQCAVILGYGSSKEDH